MQTGRHQCLIYEGTPSRHLAVVAAAARDGLDRGYRCLYLNSRPMVAGMASFMAATGLDVADEIAKGSLVMSSERNHLVGGRFDVDQMLQGLGDAMDEALDDGYSGLWASGDMTWELGEDKDFGKLLEYEWRLEEFFHQHPNIGGICQYHAGTLPREALRAGLVAHTTLFLSGTLSILNPHHIPRKSFSHRAAANADLDTIVDLLTAVAATP